MPVTALVVHFCLALVTTHSDHPVQSSLQLWRTRRPGTPACPSIAVPSRTDDLEVNCQGRPTRAYFIFLQRARCWPAPTLTKLDTIHDQFGTHQPLQIGTSWSNLSPNWYPF